MNLSEFLQASGYSRPGSDKARCPFHNDNTPSAKIHDEQGTLYCFACRKLFRPIDFKVAFNVDIDYDPNAVTKGIWEPSHEWGEVLFYYRGSK